MSGFDYKKEYKEFYLPPKKPQHINGFFKSKIMTYTEPETIRMMEEFAGQNGYAADFSQGRYHHEIYLSDARRCRPNKLKTVIRHPVKKEEKL